MSVLLQRIFLAVSLALAPAIAFADGDEENKTEEAKVEDSAEKKTDDNNEKAEEESKAEADSDSDEEKQAIVSQDDEWAEKLRKRHHEGDVALGVCGARMTALMWFYQVSVADGREDLEPAYDAIKESRTVLKNEAERRAVEDGVGTSVSVMNEYSAELWEELVNAAEEPETFQEVHDDLYTNVQECLTLFFKRGKTVKKATSEEAKDEAEKDGKAEEEKAEEKAD